MQARDSLAEADALQTLRKQVRCQCWFRRGTARRINAASTHTTYDLCDSRLQLDAQRQLVTCTEASVQELKSRLISAQATIEEQRQQGTWELAQMLHPSHRRIYR